MPEKPFSWVPKENLLSFEDLFLFIKVAIDEGVNKIRITGGEPTLRHDLDKFIKMINDYKEGLDLAITTNGYLLGESAQQLKSAGLKRINISLDTLKKDIAFKITGKDVLSKVIEGIEKSLSVGLKVKINTVPLKGINDGELIELFDYAKSKGCQIRFIEYMENSFAHSSLSGLNEKEILEIIGKKYNFKKIGREGASPAQQYKTDDGYIFGVIDPHKHDFCENCNRIRLTAEGMLIPCLYFDEAMSIKEAVEDKDILKATEVLKKVLKDKPKENRWNEENNETSSRAFYETGG